MTYTKTFPIKFDPLAHPDAVVRAPGVRISLLTPRLLRLEYDPTERFEDRPSQAFWYRRQPVPEHSTHTHGDALEIETGYLRLRYRVNPAGFTPGTLSVQLKELDTTWRYGMDDPQNLMGTTRTLDEIDGALALEPGLLSRAGWATYDDTQRLVFNQDGWLENRDASPGYQDIYFFGYGHDYNACLGDFRKLAGPVPLLPRWALGNWWSRYWAYSADELLALMDDFRSHHIPLSVCIVDMDWHITDTGNTSSGWTGYTWNRVLFPDPAAFLASLHERGLRTALNLHPAEGIHPHEDQYSEMVSQLGLNPASAEPIRFDIADPEFTRIYFELLHHPKEAQGVDFWWLDWQQGTLSTLPGLDPLWWLNHLHFYDLCRDGKTRPFIFSRWGGLGNHRYPIGFSGDTHVTWGSLAFQPYFTASAANVGYGWWSHDIGGHMSGVEDPELYLRWLQFGVFSPIMRLHSTNNPFHERRPWGYDAETERLARAALQLRHALIPYLYSMSWRDHRHGIPLVRPLYHEHPDEEAAYHCPDEYLFGSELLAAPFISPIDAETRLSRQVVWLPGGSWFDFFNSERYEAGWHAVYGDLQRIPIFARAGGIVVLAPMTDWGGVENPNTLEIHAFPGASNRFDLYEDDDREQYSLTPIQGTWSKASWKLQIGPLQGARDHVPAKRTYRIYLHALNPNAKIKAYQNGNHQEVDIHYDYETKNHLITPLQIEAQDLLEIEVTIPTGELIISDDHRLAMCRRMLSAYPLESWAKMRLNKHLPAILEEPAGLSEFELDLTERQMGGLLEVLYGAGIGHVTLRDQVGEEIILWNNHRYSDIRYHFVARDLNGRTTHRRGPLPDFAVLRSERDVLRFQQREDIQKRFSAAVEWLYSLPRRIQISGAKGIDAVVQLDINGDGGFQSHFIIQDGHALKRQGRHKTPNVELRSQAEDFLAFVNGDVSPIELYEGGKLGVIGSIELLLSFYQGLDYLPRDSFQAKDWKLEIDYQDLLRLTHKT